MPETLHTLLKKTLIQSVESSNRIEGITVEQSRLAPLLNGDVKPIERSEIELLGYKKALESVYTSKFDTAININYILKLHKMTCATSGHAGEFKKINNEIVEFDNMGRKKIRFTPASAKDTPELMKNLCSSYNTSQLPPLLKVATFIFDLLSIHPFLDGNGRVSRLLTTYLLLKEGFIVSRYISLERLTEERKEEYYAVLYNCSQGWHEAKNDIIQWWSFFLSILKDAYKEFESKISEQDIKAPKADLIRREALAFAEEFSVAELSSRLPEISSAMIKKVLAAMKDEGVVTQSGTGRGSRWRLIH
jgi:Fic family protein